MCPKYKPNFRHPPSLIWVPWVWFPIPNRYYEGAKTAFSHLLHFGFPRSGYRLRYRSFLRSL